MLCVLDGGETGPFPEVTTTQVQTERDELMYRREESLSTETTKPQKSSFCHFRPPKGQPREVSPARFLTSSERGEPQTRSSPPTDTLQSVGCGVYTRAGSL